MRRILNLYRLNFKNAIKMPAHMLKHTFRVKFTQAESTLNEYYVQLIANDGFLKSENETSYASFFPKWNAQIKTRKQPFTDLADFHQIFCQQHCQPVADAFLQYFGTLGELNILDTESHIGLSSLYLSRIFPDSRFVCTESDKENFEILKFNLAENVRNSDCVLGNLKSNPVKSIMQSFGFDKIDILKMTINHLENDTFAGDDLSFLEATKCIAFTIPSESGREIICSELEKYGFAHFEAGKFTICINQKLV